MNRKVGVFCKLNAVRSPVLEALLASHHSNYSFFSGGVLGEEGAGLPEITNDFAKRLRLSNLKSHRNHIKNLEKKILEADFLLGADDLTCQMLLQMYPEKKFISIESRAKEMGIVLADPIDVVGYEFDYLLGKFLYCGFSSFRELGIHGNLFPISALIANKANIYEESKILLESLSTEGRQPLIVDCNFKFATKSNYSGLVPENQQFHFTTKSMITLNEADLVSVSLIKPSHEVTSWEGFVTSPEWSRWLHKLSRSRPIILLCTPIDIIEGEKHNSFLEALCSDRLVYRIS